MRKLANYSLLLIIILGGLTGCQNLPTTNNSPQNPSSTSPAIDNTTTKEEPINDTSMTSPAIKSDNGELAVVQINPNGKNYFKMKGDFNGDKKIDYLVYYEVETADSIIRNLATYLYSATDQQFNLVFGDSCDKKQCYFQNYAVEDFDNNKRHEVLAIKINLDKNACNDLYVMEFKNNVPKKVLGLELTNELCQADISPDNQKIQIGEAVLVPVSEKDELKFIKQ